MSVQQENFSLFPFAKPIHQALEKMNYSVPTPIQSQAIPVLINKQDVIGLADTGTGKTAAYLLPIVHELIENPKSAALILAPTRELVEQIHAFFEKVTAFCPKIKAAMLIGGVSIRPQLQVLKRDNAVVIATPGRLIDHLQRRSIKLSGVSMYVLDEADRMLDMGFAPQLQEIQKHLPKERQTMLFTATWSKQMDELSKKILKNPAKISVESSPQEKPSIVESIEEVNMGGKNQFISNVLAEIEGQALIFARTKIRTDRLASYLVECGHSAVRIHGDRTQAQRSEAIHQMKNRKAKILVATDVAARGLDIRSITYVINYDLPQSSEDYIHRIGRTGRAGDKGHALTLVTPEDRKKWRAILRALDSK